MKNHGEHRELGCFFIKSIRFAPFNIYFFVNSLILAKADIEEKRQPGLFEIPPVSLRCICTNREGEICR